MAIYLADPPWRYEFSRSDSRKIENQYETMTLDSVAKIDFEFENNSVLYLWATAPKLPEALYVMSSWGFDYKTNIVWDKQRIGMGFWARGSHEHVLIGVKGKHSPPAPAVRRSSILSVKRGSHSRKPALLQDMIEGWFPEERKVELFARQKRLLWESHGLEIGSKIATKGVEEG